MVKVVDRLDYGQSITLTKVVTSKETAGQSPARCIRSIDRREVDQDRKGGTTK